MIFVVIVIGGLIALWMASAGLGLIAKSGESIMQTLDEEREYKRQKEFLKDHPGATPLDYARHQNEAALEDARRRYAPPSADPSRPAPLARPLPPPTLEPASQAGRYLVAPNSRVAATSRPQRLEGYVENHFGSESRREFYILFWRPATDREAPGYVVAGQDMSVEAPSRPLKTEWRFGQGRDGVSAVFSWQPPARGADLIAYYLVTAWDARGNFLSTQVLERDCTETCFNITEGMPYKASVSAVAFGPRQGRETRPLVLLAPDLPTREADEGG